MRVLGPLLAFAMITPSMLYAQTPPVSAAPTSGGTFQMPGQTVGQYQLTPVGKEIPRAASQAVPRVGTSPGGNPYIPDTSSQLPGQNIDLKNVVGPLPGSMKPPSDPTLWDKFVERYGTNLGLTPPQPRAPNWTPGISRRNRERSMERALMWWRD